MAWISSWALARLARLASSILKRSAVTAGGGDRELMREERVSLPQPLLPPRSHPGCRSPLRTNQEQGASGAERARPQPVCSQDFRCVGVGLVPSPRGRSPRLQSSRLLASPTGPCSLHSSHPSPFFLHQAYSRLPLRRPQDTAHPSRLCWSGPAACCPCDSAALFQHTQTSWSLLDRC